MNSRPFDDFSLASYASLLDRTIAAYPVAGFDMLAEPSLPDHFCIIRHDIDFSPAAALRVAEIEAERGVRANYGILLTGPFYNALERQTAATCREIGKLGHELALHFDASWHAIAAEEQLDTALRRESGILADLLDQEVRSFSFHNTTEFTMSSRADSYAGLWNAYAGRLQDEVAYVSDSNGLWRFKSWGELLIEAPRRLQVLTHPEWWAQQYVFPAERLCQIIEERSREIWQYYVMALREGKRPIVSGSPDVQAAVLDRLGEHELMRLWLNGERQAAYLKLLTMIQAESEQSATQWKGGDPALVSQILDHGKVDSETLEAAFVRAAAELTAIRAARASS